MQNEIIYNDYTKQYFSLYLYSYTRKFSFQACPIKFKGILQEFAEIYGCSLTFPKYTFQLHALNRMKSKPW